MRVALVYDRVNKIGGAERVLLALHKLFPDAPLYTSVYDKEKAPWANVFKIKTSFLQNFPYATRHELYATLMPLAFENFNFDEFDLVISVTSESAKGIVTKPHTKHICYCLTPTRYLWSAYKDYFTNPIFNFFAKPIVSYLKMWDKIAAQRPDKFIAISKEVQGRIRKYYGRESEVVYPPVVIDAGDLNLEAGLLKLENRSSIHPQASNINGRTSSFKHQSSNYFLIVSRLVPYKRVDLAVSAFDKLKLPLKIVGTGSEMGRLKSMAGPTIEFLGSLTDEELIKYYKGCRALIFPGIEDFGLTILEAQSFGKPVIAFRNGGALETIVDGKTGFFFNEQSAESLIQAIEQFDRLKLNPKDCMGQAEKFSFEKFEKEILKQVQDDK